MIILQTVGGDASLMMDRAGLLADGKFAGKTTTFQNNSYIHRLNRTLQAEMRAIAIYRNLQRRADNLMLVSTQADFDQILSEHQDAGKELVRLIILSRGIPEDYSILSVGLTKTLIQLCARMPSRFLGRMIVSTLAQLERSLLANYDRLLQEAPARDATALTELRRAVADRIEQLK